MTHGIRVLAETAETVTIGRSDFEALIQAAENAEDLAALAMHDSEAARLGRDAARRDYLTDDAVERLLDGEARSRFGAANAVSHSGRSSRRRACGLAIWRRSRPDESREAWTR